MINVSSLKRNKKSMLYTVCCFLGIGVISVLASGCASSKETVDLKAIYDDAMSYADESNDVVTGEMLEKAGCMQLSVSETYISVDTNPFEVEPKLLDTEGEVAWGLYYGVTKQTLEHIIEKLELPEALYQRFEDVEDADFDVEETVEKFDTVTVTYSYSSSKGLEVVFSVD